MILSDLFKHNDSSNLFIRGIISVFALWLSYIAYQREFSHLGFTCCGIVILYNPIFVINLSISVWRIINAIIMIALPIISLIISLKSKKVTATSKFGSALGKGYLYSSVNLSAKGEIHQKQSVETASPLESTIETDRLILELEKEELEKETELSELQLEYENLMVTLSRFNIEYSARVGKLFVELDRINLEIKEYLARIEMWPKLHNEPEGKKESKIEEMIKKSFQEQSTRINEQEEEIRHATEELIRTSKAEIKDIEELQRLKELYRILAKIYHPDRAINEEERRRFTNLMAEINQAYEKGDLEALRRFEKMALRERRIERTETLQQKIERLKKSITSLDRGIANLKYQIDKLYKSDLYKLYHRWFSAKQEGRDLFVELSTSLERDIATKRKELEDIVYKFNELKQRKK